MPVLAFASMKGGVGKTSAAVNLAYLSAAEGRRTLLVDLDPQGSASHIFRVRPAEGLRRKKLLGGGGLRAFVRESDTPGLHILPAHLSYRKLDSRLAGRKEARERLGRSLGPLADGHDLLVLDCPPGLSLLFEGVLGLADLVLAPVIPSPLSLESWRAMAGFCAGQEAGDRLLPFLSMVEQGRRTHREIVETLRRLEPRLAPAAIPRSAEVERMGERREPLCALPRPGAAALAYRELWAAARGRLASAV